MEGQKFLDFVKVFKNTQLSHPILLAEQVSNSSTKEDSVFKTIPTSREATMLSIHGRQMGTKPLDNAVVFSFQNFDRAIHTGISVGRATMNKICLPDNAISKMHASFKQNPKGDWQIVDVDSENQTRINGKVIDSNKPTPLKTNDGITFADTYHCTFFTPEGFKQYLISIGV